MKRNEKKIDKQKLFIRLMSVVLAIILVGGTLATLISQGF